MTSQKSKVKSQKFLKGRVVEGEGIGRKIGYPTANVDDEGLQQDSIDDGVYACKVLISSIMRHGICIAGVKGKREIYILDFKQDIYGQYLEAEIVERMRDLKKYNKEKDLIDQIQKDVCAAKKILSK